jgi:membrane protease YdiL (CAAX protease family)
LLFGGLAAISAVTGPDALVDPKVEVLRSAPLWLLGTIGLVAPVLEALVWTAAFVEGLAHAFRAPLLGAACGVLAYSVLFHWSSGGLAIVASAWLGCVLNYAYYVMRNRSRLAAFANTVALRWSFLAFAYVQIHSMP